MKLYNGKYIVTGLIIFLVVISFPFWWGAGRAAKAPELKFDTPAIEQLQEKRCVEDAQYMRANHVALLSRWKEMVVREGKRDYTASNGRVYQVSLTGTCLSCHANKDKFCDRCHDYTGVKPKCYSCHLVPKEVR